MILGILVLSAITLVTSRTGDNSVYVGAVIVSWLYLDYYPVFCLLMLGAYLALFFLSKKKGFWLILAVVFYGLDTVLDVYFAVSAGAIGLLKLGLDIAVHIFLLVLMIMGLRDSAARERHTKSLKARELFLSSTAAAVSFSKAEP